MSCANSGRVTEESRGGCAAEGDLTFEQRCAVAGADFAAGLDEWAEPTRNFDLDAQGLTGWDGAEDLGGTNGGEAEVGERGDLGMGLGRDACDLCQRFNHEHAGHEGAIGKVSGEECGV